MKMDIAGRGHDNSTRLERPPFAPDQADPAIIDRIAEYGPGKCDFAKGKWTGFVHQTANAPERSAGATIVHFWK